MGWPSSSERRVRTRVGSVVEREVSLDKTAFVRFPATFGAIFSSVSELVLRGSAGVDIELATESSVSEEVSNSLLSTLDSKYEPVSMDSES
ncbi:hypothetical protein GCM10011510_13860 [Streptococcus himalayensis]|uniref:Uncharacterized protein n=1 Tax=Streptococcus himalayensis TaxID=1888195 RepID=A0A917A9U1_9STRE|nr:hypothetical protein GCM10011510_13860 [Streptococcus himalayensis]